MKWSFLIVSFIFPFAVAFLQAAESPSVFREFVTRQGDKLMEGGKEYRLISFNIPNLHYVEDHLPFGETNPWRLPDEFEIRDALLSIRQMGGQAVRTYTLAVRKKRADNSVPVYVTGPGQFNEEAFRTLDLVMKVANELGVRIILPFVDQWIWWGGIGEYAAFRDRPAADFWTDSQVIGDFKQTISYLLNRTNTLTGVRYKDDKAILAWETGNELLNPVAWSREISAFIKSIDSNHLVLDGFHAGDRGLREEAIQDPNVDIVSTHHYGLPGKGGDAFLALIQKNREMTGGKKAYLLGEFGFIPTENVRQVLDTVIQNGTTGALLWSLRYHSRDGGFYWHSEPFGLGLYKAYHWPGFPSGEAYDETGLFKLTREKAFAIQGLPAPPLEPPAAPQLLPLSSAAAISWRGSAGAAYYSVERAEKPTGPWMLAGMKVDDAMYPYQPLFADTYAAAGKTYYYRVRAWNAAGFSAPSTPAGPLKTRRLTLVDELEDFSKTFAAEGLAITTKDCRQAKEDLNRVAGSNPAYLVYRTAAPIESARIFSFFAQEVADFEVSASPDGLAYGKLEFQRKDFYRGVGEYKYTKPILYEISRVPRGTLFLKIEYRGPAEIGRVEIEYGRK